MSKIYENFTLSYHHVCLSYQKIPLSKHRAAQALQFGILFAYLRSTILSNFLLSDRYFLTKNLPLPWQQLIIIIENTIFEKSSSSTSIWYIVEVYSMKIKEFGFFRGYSPLNSFLSEQRIAARSPF